MQERIAIVTGGSRGLGKSIALHLAGKGHDVILTYQSSRLLAEAVVEEIRAAGRKAAAFRLDVGKVGEFDEFVRSVKDVLAQQWRRETFDFLVNNAGHTLYKPFAETTENEFDLAVNVHFKGAYFLTQKLLPTMVDCGRIINISSGLSRYTLPGFTVYGPMKGAMEVLTRYLALELAPRGITVNALAPGAVATDTGGGVVRDDPEVGAQMASMTALGRVGQPEDIGSALAALLSDDCAWITGQRIEVSGGMCI